jgi:hypothetical protein
MGGIETLGWVLITLGVALLITIPILMFHAINIIFGIFGITLTFWQTVAIEFILVMMMPGKGTIKG